MNDNKNDQESKDDWTVSDNINQTDIIVPSFIRLFIIRRIIDKYVKNNKDKKKDKTNEEIIKELANGFKDDKNIKSLVINIVTRLINDGIKKYMDKYYNEQEEANIIEDIFNKIILEKFEQEYNEMIQYGIQNDKTTNENSYQNLLFNSSDLMNKIFQYLQWGYKFDDDLYSCSLVNSHWLYHVWNPNSVYYINFHFVHENYFFDNNRMWTRIWQRLYNVKSIYLHFKLNDSNPALTSAVNKLSLLRKVEKVHLVVFGAPVGKSISPVTAIMSRCKDRITYCQIGILHDGSDTSHFESPILRLPKVECIEIGDIYLHRVWTNECTKLKLFDVNDISQDWCKFVIKNCDCTNITTLTLDNVRFNINQVLLKQLAVKFYSLKTLKISIHSRVDDNVLLFWQFLKPIISTNKGQVQLEVQDLRESTLSKKMNEKVLKIDKLIIDYTNYSLDRDIAMKLIQERDNHGLNHLSIDGYVGKNLLDELKCKSINTFELKGYDIGFVNSLLEWKMIPQKQIFVITDVSYADYYDGGASLLQLKQFYQNVYQLFVKQIAFDIKIKCEQVKDSKLLYSYLSMYSSYFENEQFLSKYNKPKCNSNNLCLPRDKPYTYFYIHDSENYTWARYFVFGATNVQMK